MRSPRGPAHHGAGRRGPRRTARTRPRPLSAGTPGALSAMRARPRARGTPHRERLGPRLCALGGISSSRTPRHACDAPHCTRSPPGRRATLKHGEGTVVSGEGRCHGEVRFVCRKGDARCAQNARPPRHAPQRCTDRVTGPDSSPRVHHGPGILEDRETSPDRAKRGLPATGQVNGHRRSDTRRCPHAIRATPPRAAARCARAGPCPRAARPSPGSRRRCPRRVPRTACRR